MNPQDLQELKNILELEHDKIVAELRSIASPNAQVKGEWDVRFPAFELEGGSSHDEKEESADEVEEYELRIAADQSLESRLLEVNKALARIKDNTYGTCKKCHKELGLDRLRANPAAENHVEHV